MAITLTQQGGFLKIVNTAWTEPKYIPFDELTLKISGNNVIFPDGMTLAYTAITSPVVASATALADAIAAFASDAYGMPAAAPVDSVFGRTGEVVANTGDYTAAQVTNAFDKTADDTDDITVGATNKFATAAEKTKLGHITVTQAVDLDAIETRVNALDAAIVLAGVWDASAGTFPGGGTAQAGYSYIVSVAGTVDGVAFAQNDRAIAITDNASTTVYAANWFKADYTDQVLSVNGSTGAVTLTQDEIGDGATYKQYSATDKTKLAGIEASADVTDAANVGAVNAAASSKATPVDADSLPLVDSEASNVIKRVTGTNLKAYLKTYFDTLYAAVGGGLEFFEPFGSIKDFPTAWTEADQEYFQRFKCPADMSITKLWVWTNNVGTGDTVSINICNSAGTVIQGGNLTPAAVGWESVTITSTALTGGTEYWIGIKADTGSWNGLSQTTALSNANMAVAGFNSGALGNKAGSATGNRIYTAIGA